MLLGLESLLEEFRHTGRSADRQLCCRMSLFKGAGSGPSRGDIPGPLRQGETDPAPAPPRAHCWGGPGDRVIGQLPVICSGRRGNAPWNCHCQTNLWHHNNALLWQTLLKSVLNFRLVIVGRRFWSPLHSFPLSLLILAVKHFFTSWISLVLLLKEKSKLQQNVLNLEHRHQQTSVTFKASPKGFLLSSDKLCILHYATEFLNQCLRHIFLMVTMHFSQEKGFF